MSGNPNIKRWGLFHMEGPTGSIRRYQLARLEEVALANPVPGSEPPARPARAAEPETEERGAEIIPLYREKAA